MDYQVMSLETLRHVAVSVLTLYGRMTEVLLPGFVARPIVALTQLVSDIVAPIPSTMYVSPDDNEEEEDDIYNVGKHTFDEKLVTIGIKHPTPTSCGQTTCAVCLEDFSYIPSISDLGKKSARSQPPSFTFASSFKFISSASSSSSSPSSFSSSTPCTPQSRSDELLRELDLYGIPITSSGYVHPTCHHGICYQCAENYICHQLKPSTASGVPAPCPFSAYGCESVIFPADIAPFLSPWAMERYVDGWVEATLEGKSFCPNPKCGIIFSLETLPEQQVPEAQQVVFVSQPQSAPVDVFPFSLFQTRKTVPVEPEKITINPFKTNLSVHCPACRTHFCGRCLLPSHDGIVCDALLHEMKASVSSSPTSVKSGKQQDFWAQQIAVVKNETLLSSLAVSLKWKRCPRCFRFVEKSTGCDHITCRCKHQFCYSCGSDYRPRHTCRA